MKIWLDTSPHVYQKNGECKDCSHPYLGKSQRDNCVDLSVSSVSLAWPPIDDEIASIQTFTLEQNTPLSIQSCGAEMWLVCNPTDSGSMAVFDLQAMLLLSLFATPLKLSQAVQMMTGWSQKTIARAVTLFYRLGFLQDSMNPSRQHVVEGAQPLTAWLHVTNDCNLRCQYCYLHKTKENMPSSLGRQAVDAVFRSALKNGYTDVHLKYAGGEASLHMSSVIELHDYAMQLAEKYAITLEASILSNGVVLSQTAIDYLKSRHISITISLDGLGESHDSQRPLINGRGSGRYVLRTIEKLLAQEVVPFISVTVSRRNLAGLPALMEYILERDLPFSLSYYRDNDCSAHIADLRFADEQIIAAMRSAFATIEHNLPARNLLGCLLDKADMTAPHQRTCGVGRDYLVIDQHGGVAKCQMEIANPIATINMDDPLRIIRGDRQGVQGLAVEEKEGCRTCEWRYWCTGGCPITTYRATGRYDVKSPNCKIYKALFPEVLRLEALRLLRYEVPLVLSGE